MKNETSTKVAGIRDVPDAELDQLAEHLKQDGICIIREALDRGLVEGWAQSFDALLKERMNRPGGLAPREKSRYYLTLPWAPPFADTRIFAHPAVLGVLNRIFPQEYVMVQLGADVPLKGSDYQETHRDFRPLFREDIVTPLYAVAVNFALVDVTEDKGPLQMARGSHLMGREAGLEKLAKGELKLESFPMRMGDISIRSPLALHRGSPNRTETARPMVVMGYVMHWLHTPKVDLTVPKDYYDSLPPPLQKLLRCEVVDSLPEDRRETYVDFKY